MRLRDAVIGVVCAAAGLTACAGHREDVQQKPVAVVQPPPPAPVTVTVTERTKTQSVPGEHPAPPPARAANAAPPRTANAVATDEQTRKVLHTLEQVGTLRDDPRGTLLVLNANELFEVNDDDLLPEAKRKLDTVADALKDSNERIRVEAFTDSAGVEKDALKLTQERAQAVRDYLDHRGVDDDRIDAVGMGATKPLYRENSAAGRADNRRVEILVPWKLTRGVGGSGTEKH